METLDNKQHGLLVHHYLALSYAGYLIAIVLGFVLNSIFPIHYSPTFFNPLGVVFIILGTVVALWSQRSTSKNRSSRIKGEEVMTENSFKSGPYAFVRVPTQYSIFLMTLGLAFIYGSVLMIAMTILAFIVGRFYFIPKEEHHLSQKYGQAFLDYKKKVRF